MNGSGGSDPGWLSLRSKVAALTSSLSVSVLGYNLLENPEGFVVASILNFALEGLGTFAGHVALLLLDMWGIAIGALESAAGAILSPFSLAGDSVLGLIASANGWLVDVAGFAGPAAPLVALVVWAVLVIGIVTVAERLISGVVPWT